MKRFCVAVFTALAIALSAGEASALTRLDMPGCVYGENLPNAERSYACLVPHSRVDTHQGPVALSAHGNPLYLRVSPADFKFVGQADISGQVLEWSPASGWILDSRISHGQSAHIYDLAGNLHVITPAPNVTSQGYRYVDANGRIWRGDETYGSAALRVSEYTTHGDVTIGQGWNGGAVAIAPSGRFVLEPGHTTFIRYSRKGDLHAVAIAKHLESRVVFLWFTTAELASFPVERLDEPKPEPEPEPEPEPRPEPKPQPDAPRMLGVVEQVAREFPHLLQINTWESCAEFTQRVLMALCANVPYDQCEWGHVGKNPGEGGADVAPGIRVSHDVIWHRPSNRQVDILAYAAANSHPDPIEVPPGPATTHWDPIPREFYRPNNLWTPTVPVGGEPGPRPDPKPDPKPDVCSYPDLKPQLQQCIDHATHLMDQLHEAQRQRDEQWARGDELERERNELVVEVQRLRNAQPRMECSRIFGIRYNCRLVQEYN